MKTCVFITGTNAVGKSSLAKAILQRFGGVDRIVNDVTYCVDGRVCLAGKYGATRFGGVDRIVNDKGSSCTSRLAEVVEEGLKTSVIIVCEGMYMNTFGMNLTNALFKADKQLVVSLYADGQTLYNRITSRSNGKNNDGKRNWPTVFRKQKQAMIAARKYQSIGVKVLQFNTAETDTEQIADKVLKTISELCGDPTIAR